MHYWPKFGPSKSIFTSGVKISALIINIFQINA